MSQDRTRTRRGFLRRGAGVWTTASAVALAGCTGLLGGGSDGEETTQTGASTDTPLPGQGNLVAYYRFDDGSSETAADATGNGNDATVTGATWTDRGKVGGSLSFDGTDDVVQTPVEYASLTGGFTFEAWARNDDLSAGWQWVYTQRREADQYSQLGTHGTGDGILRWELRFGNGTQGTIDAPEGSIEEGTWHHWVGTWAKGQGLRLYIDGERVATSAEEKYCERGCSEANTRSLASAGPINVGAQGRKQEYWTGLIDEAKIYDRALTADEVATIYEATS